MRRLLVTLILGVFLASAAGCADLGISNPFESTPTAANSQLLGISLPAGMELSTQHCARTTGSDGQPQGMETAYGQADRMQVAQSLFNNMPVFADGLQLRGRDLGLGKDGRRFLPEPPAPAR